MKLYPDKAERKPDPQPIETNLKRLVLVGLILWCLALAVFVIFPATVPATRPWWPWTCVIGIILGIYAFFKVQKR
ncbi:MAG: DUF2530 domain-containing protein [Microbacteriaceae bacterium]